LNVDTNRVSKAFTSQSTPIEEEQNAPMNSQPPLLYPIDPYQPRQETMSKQPPILTYPSSVRELGRSTEEDSRTTATNLEEFIK
ncbi:hypothetical protein HDV06_001260, partial [Boothiomyces sp. JEL0866]